MSNPYAAQVSAPATPAKEEAFAYINQVIPCEKGNMELRSTPLFLSKPNDKAIIDGMANGSITEEDLACSIVVRYRLAKSDKGGLIIKKAPVLTGV